MATEVCQCPSGLRHHFYGTPWKTTFFRCFLVSFLQVIIWQFEKWRFFITFCVFCEFVYNDSRNKRIYIINLSQKSADFNRMVPQIALCTALNFKKSQINKACSNHYSVVVAQYWILGSGITLECFTRIVSFCWECRPVLTPCNPGCFAVSFQQTRYSKWNIKK